MEWGRGKILNRIGLGPMRSFVHGENARGSTISEIAFNLELMLGLLAHVAIVELLKPSNWKTVGRQTDENKVITTMAIMPLDDSTHFAHCIGPKKANVF